MKKRVQTPRKSKARTIRGGDRTRESVYSARAALWFARQGYTTFRNNVGAFLTLDGKRKVRCGLHPGSSDRIGWRSVEITPEMVGQRLAVFVAIEVKRPDGSLSDEQGRFLSAVHEAGGEAVLVVGEGILRWGDVK